MMICCGWSPCDGSQRESKRVEYFHTTGEIDDRANRKFQTATDNGLDEMGWEVAKERNSICRKMRNGGAEISIKDTVMLHHSDTSGLTSRYSELQRIRRT